MQATQDIRPPVFGIWADTDQLASEINRKADTVYRAWKRQRLPVDWWPELIDAAAQRGKLLTADTLLAFNTPRPKRGKRAMRGNRRKRGELRVV